MTKILTLPSEILRRPAKTIEKIDKKVLKIIGEMKKTLEEADNPRGVGLAAPQIGKSRRIFLLKPFGNSPVEVFINPEILWKSEELTTGVPERENKLEGCLSLPGVWGTVRRHQAVKIKYQDTTGKIHLQKFSGFSATIIQHEMDHLEGRLFPFRVLEQKGKLYKIKKNKEGREVLEEIRLT